jgi:hypothetical protein
MPYDPNTGKHYDYTKEGIEEFKEETGGGMPYTPFKMKGFSGFGNSPVKGKEEKKHIHHGSGKEWAHKHYSKVAHADTAAAHNVSMNVGGKESAEHLWKQDPKTGDKVKGSGVL